MDIIIKAGGPLRLRIEGLVKGIKTLELPPGSKVSDAFKALELDVTEVRVIMLNGRPVHSDLELKEGDRLAIWPPELAFNKYVAINFFNVLARDKIRESR